MELLDLTLPTPAENLALDEALLDEAEAAGRPYETLRLWESPTPLIVVGRSSKVSVEVNLAAAQAASVPTLRRCSGGAAIVAGPACLMYAVVLSYEKQPQLQMLDEAHRFVLGHIQAGLRHLDVHAELCGTSDLALDGRKFSGNSLRCKRTHLMYHGTLLCHGYRTGMISELLGTPPRQPDYRQGRDHRTFVTNLPIDVAAARRAVLAGWSAANLRTDWPRERTAELVAARYSQANWNLDGA